MAVNRFREEAEEIRRRVMSEVPEPPAWARAQKQPRERSRTRAQVEAERLTVMTLLNRAKGTDPMFAEAKRRVIRRLDNGWMGSGTRIDLRRKYHFPVDRSSSVAVMTVDQIELLIMRTLALTSPAHQYAVSKSLHVFATAVNGYSKDDERVWMSGLSPLVDDVGQFYADWRRQLDGHIGGRFFERDGHVFDGPGRTKLLTLST
jgi:hypothetical protein